MADHTWLDELKAALFISTTGQDALLNSVLANVEQAIEDYTGLTLLDPGADVTEYQDGNDTRFCWTSQAPIKSITSVHIDSTRQWDATYELIAANRIVDWGNKNGEIRIVYDTTATFDYFPAGEDNVRIIYRPGWATVDVPNSLLRAALLWGALAFKIWESRRHGISTTSQADGNVTYWERKPPPEVEMLLRPWIRRGYGG